MSIKDGIVDVQKQLRPFRRLRSDGPPGAVASRPSIAFLGRRCIGF